MNVQQSIDKSKRKLLYIHQHFCTPKGHGGTRSYEFAKRWSHKNYDITIITGHGYDQTLTTRGTSKIEGFTVKLLGSKYHNTMGFHRRVASFFRFTIESTLFCLRHGKKYNLVLATSTPLTIAIPALTCSLVHKTPFIFEVRDVWPDVAIEIGALRNRTLKKLAFFLERIAYKKACHIVPLSSGMESRILGKGVPAEKCTTIPNCSDTDRFYPNCTRRSKSDKFRILYSGSISLANDIEFLGELVLAAKPMKQVEWVFAGEGNRLFWLEKFAFENKLSNLKILGKVAKNELPKLFSSCHAGLVSFRSEPIFYENSPNKFFDYAAAGLPTIFTRTTWLADVVEENDIGFISKDRSTAPILDYITQLSSSEAKRIESSKRIRTIAETMFSRDLMAKRYEALLSRFADTKRIPNK
ncbi:glycosyltransferase family 4 protein [Pelagicoccus sp. SDUM812005]|uniref:glycosyltransferase family 4 protein n=1 Tax=Pelagicoccus sp. SDUM812005 TaxID=3041257 RepID=UPI00280F80C2|nr:glycosyltransferase family 4 protein [Pelagicoccus sp. SDUM812005]MDQ8180804.1 glycosyltransferase family 4 protein [Pelagicoccus sp. SDUM812005]